MHVEASRAKQSTGSQFCCEVVPTPTYCEVVPVPTYCEVVPVPTYCEVVPTPTYCEVVPTPIYCEVVPTPIYCEVVPTPELERLLLTTKKTRGHAVYSELLSATSPTKLFKLHDGAFWILW